MAEFCEHYHIHCGECQCWLKAKGKLPELSPEELQKDYAVPTDCHGDEKRCDFKKIGGKADERL